MSFTLTTQEQHRLKVICNTIGKPEYGQWLIDAVTAEVSNAHRFYCNNLPAPGQSLKAATAFEKALRQALRHWNDCGDHARRQIGLALSEAAALDPARCRPNTADEQAALTFATTDAGAAHMVQVLLAHLADTVKAAPVESPRQRTADRQAKQALADSIVLVASYHLDISKHDWRGIYRLIVRVGLGALGRACGFDSCGLDDIMNEAMTWATDSRTPPDMLRGRTEQKPAGSTPK